MGAFLKVAHLVWSSSSLFILLGVAHLESRASISPQLHADNLKCTSYKRLDSLS